MTLPTSQDIFQKGLFSLIGFEDASDEAKQRVLEKMTNIVENRMIIRLNALLGDEDTEAWKKLLDTQDLEAADVFLKERNINLDNIVLEEMAILKAQLAYLLNTDNPVQASDLRSGAR